ncbi:MAG: DUF4038 domain-containing protein [Clostridiales bacterium]|nr:DUF4038 domain-containing protein [Clostridiales bacterium]
MLYVMQNSMLEWSYTSGKKYKDPYNQVELSVLITDPDGIQSEIPAFWAGDQIWRIRYASSKIGRHHFRTLCTDMHNSDLHGREGAIEVTSYEGNNSLLKHGPLHMSDNRRYLKHADGTPFFWLGDTWWMGLTSRLRWPEDFQLLTADRVKKGFSVIQIVAGLYPDMEPFDKRGANEAGFPWKEDYSCINPSYFDMADLRISWLVNSGLVPCIVGSWGYFLDFAGMDVIKKHWRYLVARYGAYPMVWCIAGEPLMAFYGSTNWSDEKNEKYKMIRKDKKLEEEYLKTTKAGWTEVTAYVRSLDPYHHPITIHDVSHRHINDISLIDINMLQTGHAGWKSLDNTVGIMAEALAIRPQLPVIDGEACYEGIGGTNGPDIQRFIFWAHMLSGAAGHTYGANGLWQFNTREKPYGPSPHGMSWGDVPWEDAYRLPGSKHLGLCKKLLERYPWWQFEPHPEWAEPHAGKDNCMGLYAAGIPGEVRVIYKNFFTTITLIKGLESDVTYRAFFYDPATGKEYDCGVVKPDEHGNWKLPYFTIEFLIAPICDDVVLVLERSDRD